MDSRTGSRSNIKGWTEKFHDTVPVTDADGVDPSKVSHGWIWGGPEVSMADGKSTGSHDTPNYIQGLPNA